MNDYGHIDDQTTSLAISLYPEYRNQGIGNSAAEFDARPSETARIPAGFIVRSEGELRVEYVPESRVRDRRGR